MLRIHQVRPTPPRASRGSALIPALAITIAVATLCAAMLQQGVASLRERSAVVDRQRAFYLAEAGLAEGMRSLRDGGTGNIGSDDVPARFGDGAFWVTCNIDESGIGLLESTSISGRARARLAQAVQAEIISIGALGIFGDERVTIEGGVSMGVIDTSRGDDDPVENAKKEKKSKPDKGKDDDKRKDNGNDSSAPAPELFSTTSETVTTEFQGGDSDGFETTRPGTTIGATNSTDEEIDLELSVGSNGSITIESSPSGVTVIGGDVVPGVDGSLEIGLNVEITGSTAPRANPMPKPELEAPDLPTANDIALTGGQDSTFNGLQGTLGSIEVAGGSTLTLTGGTRLVVDRLELAPGANLALDTSAGPIELWVRDSLQIPGGADLQALHADPAGLSIIYTGQDAIDLDGDLVPDPALVFEPQSDFYGTIYAPDAHLRIADGTRAVGSIAARELTLGRNSTILFDNALLEAGAAGAEADVYGIAWHVLDVPTALRTDLSTNLVTEKEKAYGARLPTPVEAEQAPNWGIVYLDTRGSVKKYFGDEPAFDWNQVDTVVETFADTTSAALAHARNDVKRTAKSTPGAKGRGNEK